MDNPDIPSTVAVNRYSGLPPVVSEKNHIPSSTCLQAEIARTGMVSCPAVRAQISSGHRTVRQKEAGDGIQCGFPSHENTIVFHAAIKYAGTRGSLKSMPFLFAQLGCPERNHMAMTSAHGAGGLPVEAGYSHEYTALPASFFAFIGFALLLYFWRRYEYPIRHLRTTSYSRKTV